MTQADLPSPTPADDTPTRLGTAACPATAIDAARLLLEAVAVGPGEMLLDLAAGLGHGAGLASHRGAIATGIASEEALLDQARRVYPNALYYTGTPDSLVFANGFFAAVIHHGGTALAAAAETRAAIVRREVFRVLQPGGRYAGLYLGRPEVGAVQDAGSGQSAWDADSMSKLRSGWQDVGFDAPRTVVTELAWQPVTASDRELLARVDTTDASTPITLVRWPALLLVAAKPR